MNARFCCLLIVLGLWLAAPTASAGRYASLEQVKARLFAPDAEFVELPAARVAPARVWEVRQAGQRRGWLIADAVIGKHALIDYALSLDAAGAVTGLDVLVYRESYGYEVADARWRAQFVGLSAENVPRMGDSVDGIAGATLSCRHLTEAVADWTRRITALP